MPNRSQRGDTVSTDYIDEDGAQVGRPSIPSLMRMARARTRADHNPPGAVAIDITVDTAAFTEALQRMRDRAREFAEAVAPALARIAEQAEAAYRPLGKALRNVFGRLTYITPEGPAPLPVTDAASALAALEYAEQTVVVRHPDKATRALAKRHRLTVRRHLDHAYRPRLRAVATNQFGGLG